MVPKIEWSTSLNMPELMQFRKSVTVRHGINELQQYINFDLFREKLEELCKFKKMGRPHYDVVQMFKILILQTLYNLSDEEMEFQLYDRLSFQHFTGIGYNDNIPDARTIWKFRERLGSKGSKELFDLFLDEMKKRGLQCSQGKLVDATFQEAPEQRNTPEENKIIKDTGKAPESWSKKKKAHKDIDATWVDKGKERHYGYKAHVRADEKSKVIENYETTTAKIHDNNVCAELFPDADASQPMELLADAGYFGKNTKQAVKAKGMKPRIMQRRVKGQKELSKWQERRNHAIAKRRCTIEHIFGAIKHFGGDIVRSIGLERCRIRHGLVFMLYNMKRFCFLSRTGQLCPDGIK